MSIRSAMTDAERMAYDEMRQRHDDYCEATQRRIVAERVEYEARLASVRARAFYHSQYGEDE